MVNYKRTKMLMGNQKIRKEGEELRIRKMNNSSSNNYSWNNNTNNRNKRKKKSKIIIELIILKNRNILKKMSVIIKICQEKRRKGRIRKIS